MWSVAYLRIGPQSDRWVVAVRARRLRPAESCTGSAAATPTGRNARGGEQGRPLGEAPPGPPRAHTRRLLALPPDQPADEPGARYRRAAAALAAWRSDGTLRKDPAPAIYAYEQAYDVPGTNVERAQRGFFARLPPA